MYYELMFGGGTFIRQRRALYYELMFCSLYRKHNTWAFCQRKVNCACFALLGHLTVVGVGRGGCGFVVGSIGRSAHCVVAQQTTGADTAQTLPTRGCRKDGTVTGA